MRTDNTLYFRLALVNFARYLGFTSFCSPVLYAAHRLSLFAVSVGADRRDRGLSWWTMPSKGSQVARARNIDGEMVVSHEGPYQRPPRRTFAGFAGNKGPLRMT